MSTTAHRSKLFSESSYQYRRSLMKQKLFRVIECCDFPVMIRGSWVFNDFHLCIDESHTHSDLDLIEKKGSQFNVEELREDIEKKVRQIIWMKVSIHPEDHLSQISLHDSKIKNILEYVIHWRNNKLEGGSDQMNYMKAKIMMLLMKKTEKHQRFYQIKNDLPVKAMHNLYNIKTGVETMIYIEELEKLILTHGDEFACGFFKNCILQNPSEAYGNKIYTNFLGCSTISDWLKTYVINKLKHGF